MTIDHIHVKSSNGKGLSVYDTNGIVDIVHCNFTKNGRSKGPGGGGTHIEFTFCSPGTVRNCSGHHGQNCNSNYTIRNCTFSDNIAYSPHQPKIGEGVNVTSSGYGALFSSKVKICFKGNTYFYGNKGSAIVRECCGDVILK